MIVLTKRRKDEIMEVLEYALKAPVGEAKIGEGIWEIDPEAIRDFIRMDMRGVLDRKPRWWFWRRNKKCVTIPCPPFTDEVLNTWTGRGDGFE